MARGSRSFTFEDYRRITKENDKMKNDLIRAYTLVKQEMLALLGEIQLGNFMTEDLDYTSHYNSIIQQIDLIIEDLNNLTLDTLQELLPRQFALGQMAASIGLASAGVPVVMTAGAFSMVDQNAVKAIVSDTFEDLARSNKTMGEFFKRTLRNTVKEQVLKNVIAGDPVKMSSAQLKDKLLEQGFKGFVKKNGAKMDVDDYAALVLHTKTMQSHNDGTALFMVQHGYDLVYIPDHKTSCDLCKKYTGKVYSISGTSDKYPPLSSIPNSGPPFHPQCRHPLIAYIEKFHDGTLDEDFNFEQEFDRELQRALRG